MSLISRPLTIDDRPLVSKWLAEDPYHSQAGITWDDVTMPGTYSEIVMDEDGVILTVVRYHAALRAAMQFNPDATYRIAKHGHDLKKLLEDKARSIGAKEVIIRPGGKAVNFSKKLGFTTFEGSKIVEI